MIKILEVVDAKFIMKNLSRVSKRMNALCSDDSLWNQKLESLPWSVEGEISAAWRQNLGSSKAVFRLLTQVGWLDGFWMLDEKPRGALMRVIIKNDVIESTLIAPSLKGSDPLELQAISDFAVHEPFRFTVGAGGEVRVMAENEELPAREFFRFTGSTPEDARAKVQFYTKGTARPLFFKLVQRGDRRYSCVSHERSPLHTGIPHRPVPTGRQGMSGGRQGMNMHGAGRSNNNMQYGAHYGPTAARGALGQAVPQQAAAHRRPAPTLYTDSAFDQARRLQGLWRGDFGPHGTEILCITICNLISSRFTELVGLKCSGDPNVPCGEFAFRVPLTCESGGVESMRATTTFSCDCAFQCECPKPLHGEDCVHARQIYDGLTLVAEHGFQSPTWNGGAIVELQDGSGDILVVWKGLFSVRFTRLSDDFAEELRHCLPAQQKLKPAGNVDHRMDDSNVAPAGNAMDVE